jgi:hypothetical protein
MGARGTPSLDAEVDADEVAVAMAAVAERLEDAEATSVCVLAPLNPSCTAPPRETSGVISG